MGEIRWLGVRTLGMALRFRKWLVWVIALQPLSSVCGSVDFARQVQPFFAEHCLECHGPDDEKGGLVLTTQEGALAELESGARGIVPGKPEQSEVIRRLLSNDPKQMMPPPKQRAKHAVTTAQVEMLKQWIAEGAAYVAHWAYQPVRSLTPPPVSDHPVDAWVRQRLQQEGITPAAEADKVTLIRRVHYDLLGLPPSPEQVQAFLSDSSDLAYEAMVDRALASEHFGERWGRHWLDMARYADSDGYEKDRPRPDAWRFRDWVIRAVNEDMPFDQFTIEQLAGDLLPEATPEQVVATAFNRQTLTNTEGGTDQEQFRVEACFDRTETLGTVWLGLTVGCARCHTHKYDEITHAEYFQLFAFFNNGDEVTRQVPTTPEAWATYEKANGQAAQALIPLRKQVDEAKAKLPVKLPEWEKKVQARRLAAQGQQAVFTVIADATATAESPVKLVRQPDGSFLAEGPQAKQERYTVEVVQRSEPVASLRIEVLPDEKLPKRGPGRSSGGNFVLSEVDARVVQANGAEQEIVLHSAKASFEQKGFGADGVLDGKSETGWAVSGGAGKAHSLTLHLAEPLTLPAGAKLKLRLQQHYAKGGEHSLGRFRVLAAAEETEGSIAPAAVLRILNEEPKRRNPVVIQALYDWLEKVDPEVQQASRALALAEAKLPKPPLMDVRVIAQRSQQVRDTRILLRGEFLQPGTAVQAGALAVLPPIKPSSPSQGGQENLTRLDLARWLVSPEHPLTPRVTVNHVWAQLFGQGLVKTVADFGVRGEAPSHPELLDALAATFVKEGWSRKKLLRLIMTSATYKQTSDPTMSLAPGGRRSADELARLTEQDPLNVWLWRQNRVRVQGEIVRDLYLAAAGLLSRKVGGPSVFPPMAKEVAELSYANNFKWTTSAGEDRYRRGMYTFFKRTAPHPELMTFDCPDANLTNVQRTVSNTPLQALATLNAEAFVEAAQGLARRVLASANGAGADEQRLQRAFEFCLSRQPTAAELQALKTLLTEARYHYQQTERAEVEQICGGEPAQASAELAAWVATARIVLNVDEFITRS